ncbi:MAG: ABC transporter substrate-binding protein [Thermodesulfobacteria bacterium]|nr:ABC transporter substrate-binding protein [Thermodesulfobacteriota bacterium]
MKVKLLRQKYKTFIQLVVFLGFLAFPLLPAFSFPQRIVSLSPFITESLYILGVQDKIVGSTIYDRTPGASTRTKVGSITDVNIEKILSLHPDLVLATDLTPYKEIKRLRELGLRVEVFSFWKSFNTLCSEFLRLGKVVGRENKALNIIKAVRKEVKEIHDKVKNLPKPKVVVEIGVNPLWVAPKRSFINDYIVLAGGKNVGPLTSGHTTREEVIKWNPDVIIISNMGFVAEEELKRWEKFPMISAVRNHRIYIIDSDDLCSPTPPRFVQTLMIIAKWLHPEVKFKPKTKIKRLSLPKELKAKALIMYKYEGPLFWEKTLVVQLQPERRVLSTMDGLLKAKLVVNHSASPLFWYTMCQLKRKKNMCGGLVYLKEVKEKLAKKFHTKPSHIALIATAADMDNLAVVTKKFSAKGIKIVVTALVTAGAKTNALRTGVDEGWYLDGINLKEHGTVNVILLTNLKLTDAAMARAIITITEAKTAAFQDLKVHSTYTPKVIATGTGTDSVIVVSGTEPPLVNYTGGHSKIGELIGKAVYQAVSQALCKQNGFCREVKK